MNEEKNQVTLLPHNEEGYNELIECLKNNQMVALNRATGTGKSFIILKYLAEHKDKKILYLSPTYPIIDQLIEHHMKELEIDYNSFETFDTEIYSNLLDTDMEELAKKYDIIILDEYHRCGAREWGRQIKRLLDYIKKYKPETKVIGTTATEIRYLDNERNMNNILFDGVCASKLTLADAILRGILPVPVYINTMMDCFLDLEVIENRVRKKCFYQEELNYYLEKINEVRKKISDILIKEEKIENYLPENGKYLAFAPTIKKIEKTKEFVRKLLRKTPIEFSVHSKQSKEINKYILNEFRNYTGNEDIVLYSVNILNEGVHVKNVDAIFMMRPTNSPIIFFQQLGRLLSYSKRKDQVVVVDTVNNLKRSPYIYSLYREVTERAKKLIKTDPNNSKHYEKILENFKIVDLSSKICEELDKLKSMTTKEEMNIHRLDIAINILSGKKVANNIEKLQAQIDIFKLKKFVTVEQFKKIKKLNLETTELYALTEEEFIFRLSGYRNLYEQNNNVVTKVSNEVKQFYNTNYRLPSIFASSKSETTLAKKILKNIGKITESMEYFLFDAADEELSQFERIIYESERNTDINIEQLYNELDEVLKLDIQIPTRITLILEKEKTKISQKYISQIYNHNLLLIKEKEIYKEETFKEEVDEVSILNKIFLREDFEETTKQCLQEISNTTSIKDYLIELTEQIKSFIKEKHTMPNYYRTENNEVEIVYEKTLFYKSIIFQSQLEELGLLEEIENTYEKDQQNRLKIKKDTIITDLKDFVEKHNGDFPSIKIDNPEEQALARKFSSIKENITEEEYDSLMSEYVEKYAGRHREVIDNYISFIQKYKRYPLLTSTNEYEIKLIEDYTRNEPFITTEEKIEISSEYRKLNKREVMKNSYKELLKTRKEQK